MVETSVFEDVFNLGKSRKQFKILIFCNDFVLHSHNVSSHICQRMVRRDEAFITGGDEMKRF